MSGLFYYQTSSILVNADRYCQCNQCSFIERFFSVAGHLFQRFLMACLIGQNILTNYFHVKYHSTSIRQVEAGLRATLIKKIQELSIPYQKNCNLDESSQRSSVM